MSLLLVKRAYKTLHVGEAMSIALTEPQSVADVFAYLSLQSTKINKRIGSGVTTIRVLKQDY